MRLSNIFKVEVKLNSNKKCTQIHTELPLCRVPIELMATYKNELYVYERVHAYAHTEYIYYNNKANREYLSRCYMTFTHHVTGPAKWTTAAAASPSAMMCAVIDANLFFIIR